LKVVVVVEAETGMTLDGKRIGQVAKAGSSQFSRVSQMAVNASRI
jgi:hypothetical protein